VPRRLAAVITGHSAETVCDLGWGSLTDGALIERMNGRYDVLVTVDRGIRHQQRLQHRRFGVVLLRAPTNRLADLHPLVPLLLEAIDRVRAGEVLEISAPRS
jgi:hypothetical protein